MVGVKLKDFVTFLYNNYNYKRELTLERVMAILCLVDFELRDMRSYSLSFIDWDYKDGRPISKNYDLYKELEKLGIVKMGRKNPDKFCLSLIDKKYKPILNSTEQEVILQYIKTAKHLNTEDLMTLVGTEF